MVERLMRVVLIALMLAVVAVPAQARGKRSNPQTNQPSAAEKLKKAQADEKDYKAALDRIPDKKPADPWGNVR
jgi:hypothetical protein